QRRHAIVIRSVGIGAALDHAAKSHHTGRLNEPVESWLFELPRPADGRTRILDLGGGPPP
ncbi:MAG: hypothetical protein AAB253_04145, partial [candidate division NC10 bacterium]